MNYIQFVVLGLVQGVTEFLPVSSSAHLVLTPYFFNWEDPGLSYDVALHMGTLIALAVFFWRDWLEIARDALKGKFRLLTLIVVGCIPAVPAGLLLEKKAEHAFRSPPLIAATLAIFALVLWYFDRKGRKDREIGAMAIGDALMIGCAQAIAIVPGVSRSGITITAALFLGLTRPAAARFSFLMALPITAGAGLLKSKYIISTIAAGGDAAAAVGVGFAASLLSGLAALGLLTYIVRSKTFNIFVAYRLALSLVIVVIFIVR